MGTFYGFLDRLYPDRPRRHTAPRRPSGRTGLLKPDQTMLPKRPGATNRVARRVARPAPRPRVTDRGDTLLAAIMQESTAASRPIIPAWNVCHRERPLPGRRRVPEPGRRRAGDMTPAERLPTPMISKPTEPLETTLRVA